MVKSAPVFGVARVRELKQLMIVVVRTFTEAKALQGSIEAKNFEEFWIASIGRTLYGKFIDGYSQKMWMVEDNKTIDDFTWSPKGVTLKEGPREAWDSAISAYPYAPNGYDDYFQIATADINLLLNTRIDTYDLPNKSVVINGETLSFDVIFNTASPDLVPPTSPELRSRTSRTSRPQPIQNWCLQPGAGTWSLRVK